MCKDLMRTQSDQYLAAGLRIAVGPGGRSRWRRLMEDALRTQCENMQVPADDAAPDILFRDYEELASVAPSDVVGANYSVRDGAFVDHRSRNALRFSGGQLIYWHDVSLTLSIPQVVQIALVQKGRSFVHSAAVSIGGRAHVFPGFGGIGKTLLVSDLMRHPGAKLLGDDLVVLNPAGTVQSYARPFCLYPYHRGAFKQQFSALGIRHMRPAFPWRVYRRIRMESAYRYGARLPWPGRYLGIDHDYVLASPYVLFGPDRIETSQVPLETVAVVKRSASASRVSVDTTVDVEQLSAFCASVTAHEWNHSARTLLAFDALSAGTRVGFFEGTRAAISRCLPQASRVALITLPDQFRPEEYFAAVRELIGLRTTV